MAATVLGIFRRTLQAEAHAWAGRQPRARHRICPTFLAKMSRRRGEVVRCFNRPVRLESPVLVGLERITPLTSRVVTRKEGACAAS